MRRYKYFFNHFFFPALAFLMLSLKLRCKISSLKLPEDMALKKKAWQNVVCKERPDFSP